MKAAELREKSVDELNGELLKLLEEQFIQKSTGQLAQTHLLTQARKDIARVKTVLRQKAGN